MKNFIGMGSIIATAIVLTLLGWASPSVAQVVGSVTAVKGTAGILRGGSRLPLRLNDAVEVNDIIETGKGAMVKIIFKDGVLVTIGTDSRAKIDRWLFDEKKRRRNDMLLLLNGIARVILEKFSVESHFEITGSNAVAGVKGTDFVMQTWKIRDVTRVYVFDGVVLAGSLFRPHADQVTLGRSQWTEVVGRNAPLPPRPLSEEMRRQLDRLTTLRDQVMRKPLKDIVRKSAGTRKREKRQRRKGPQAAAESGPANTQVRVVGSDLTLPPSAWAAAVPIQAGRGAAPTAPGRGGSQGGSAPGGIPGVSSGTGSIPLGQPGDSPGLGGILGQ